MPDWIAKANIDHFKKLLEKEKDPRKRAVIERELAEEESKLAVIEGAQANGETSALKKDGEPKKD
jgi:hypothetical protein